MNQTKITIDSSRFGSVEISQGAVIDFPDGMIGLGGQRWTLLATDENSPFFWLHSVDDGSLAMPVTNPRRFFPDFRLELSESEAKRLDLTEQTPIDIYVTVRAAPALSDCVANLRAPIVVHAGVGRQVINQAAESPLRAPLFPDGQAFASPSAA
jgi:flagellar assembly factor FliW